jgi:NTP pyrophosphatase (non-canonical NTP hydrolase)
MSYADIENKIEMWGINKGIIGPNGFGTAASQAKKTVEEVEELVNAVCDDNKAEIIDAIGDIGVTLLMQCHIQGVTFEECLRSAYDVISKRKGRMVDGQFVKES